jgi:O-antigen/teichoic acid export membrane protein
MVRSTVANLAGTIVPLMIQIATVPLYLKVVGPERYGVLTLVWLLLGYFGLFDLGFGRAIASRIASMHDEPPSARAGVFWTGTILSLIAGVIGGACLFVVGRYLFANVFSLSSELRSESYDAMPWIAAILPVATVISALAGALQGRQDFVSMNIGQMIGMVLYQLIPLAIALSVSATIPWLVAATIVGRLVTAVLLLISCLREVPASLNPVFLRSEIAPMMVYGGWATVTSVVSPILMVFDRFVIGATAGMDAVAIYSVPYNVIVRLAIFPTSWQVTLFPRYAMKSEAESRQLLLTSISVQSWMITPIVLTGILLVKPFLYLWVGPAFAASAAPVGQILFLGLWFSALAFIPYSLLQSRGRPDIPAKFHVGELLLYAPALWLGVSTWGIDGAAWAWDFRVILDAMLLLYCVRAMGELLAASLGLLWVFAAFLWALLTPMNSFLYFWGTAALFIGCGMWTLYRIPPLIVSHLQRSILFSSGSLFDRIRRSFAKLHS